MTLLKPASQLGLTMAAITPRPKTRNFIVASVGSGKSTLFAALLEEYHRQHPAHRIYLVDPKMRYFAQPDRDNPAVFPEGTRARVHGRREGVTVNGRLLMDANGYRFKNEQIFIVQSEAKAHELMAWVYENHDVRSPMLLAFDESFDFLSGPRADPQLRKTIQMGRELGLGTLIINQRPRNVDRTFLTESDRIYYGDLHHHEDRDYMSKVATFPRANLLKEPVSRFHWWMLDQINRKGHYFHLTQGEKDKTGEKDE